MAEEWAGQVQGMILDTSEEWQVVEGEFCWSWGVAGKFLMMWNKQRAREG